MAGLEGEGLGLGLGGRITGSVKKRAENIKGTVKETKRLFIEEGIWVPGAVFGVHVNRMRQANRELAPALKEL